MPERMGRWRERLLGPGRAAPATDAHAPRPEGFIETPPQIAEWTAEQQAVVPYFGLGHRLTDIPDSVYLPLLEYWRAHRDEAVEEPPDEDHMGTTHGSGPATLILANEELNYRCLEELRPTLEDWFGGPLVGEAAYGLRIYQPGAFLHPHVDTLETHVISATMCIEQDIATPWPLYVKTHEGEELFVEMKPGQMVLYESAIIEHGRPVPLDGRYHVSMFMHSRPPDWEHYR